MVIIYGMNIDLVRHINDHNIGEVTQVIAYSVGGLVVQEVSQPIFRDKRRYDDGCDFFRKFICADLFDILDQRCQDIAIIVIDFYQADIAGHIGEATPAVMQAFCKFLGGDHANGAHIG